MASEGLSRRRVNHASSASTSLSGSGGWNDEDDGEGRKAVRTSSGGGGISGSGSGHAGSAFTGGSRIAYDPHELAQTAGEEQRVGGKLPRLTILEEVMLLGVKDKQGYLSFWNDNISYTLRGCILIELALRRRIAVVKDAGRRRVSPSERIVEVVDTRQTGETILDEALKLMKGQQDAGERLSVGTWIDLMSGETWNITKVGFQLKQVRERLLKGLVDKGILRTEQRNFLLFDMATHPLADVRTKEHIIARVVSLLTSTTSAIPPLALRIPSSDSSSSFPSKPSPKNGNNGNGHGSGAAGAAEGDEVQCRVTRTAALVCCAYAASVLDNAFGRLGYEEREAAFARCDDILNEFAVWPFGEVGAIGGGASSGGFGSTSQPRRAAAAASASRIATGSANTSSSSSGGGGMADLYAEGRESVASLVREARKEARGEEDLGFEVVSGVLEVLGKLDSLL